MKWFGTAWPHPRWPAPICEDPCNEVATPVGEPCIHCGEAIAEGDSGVVTPVIMSASEIVIGAEHKECLVRSTAGPLAHLDRRCRCFGGTDHASPDLTARQEAVEVYRRVVAGEYP